MKIYSYIFWLIQDPEMRVFVWVVGPNHARWLACQVCIHPLNCIITLCVENYATRSIIRVVIIFLSCVTKARNKYLAIFIGSHNWITCPPQAFQRGMSYPTHQFLILGASDGSWLIEPDPTADLGCSLEDRIQTLQFALTVSIPDTRTRETSAAPVGGLVGTTVIVFMAPIFTKMLWMKCVNSAGPCPVTMLNMVHTVAQKQQWG